MKLNATDWEKKTRVHHHNNYSHDQAIEGHLKAIVARFVHGLLTFLPFHDVLEVRRLISGPRSKKSSRKLACPEPNLKNLGPPTREQLSSAYCLMPENQQEHPNVGALIIRTGFGGYILLYV